MFTLFINEIPEMSSARKWSRNSGWGEGLIKDCFVPQCIKSSPLVMIYIEVGYKQPGADAPCPMKIYLEPGKLI